MKRDRLGYRIQWNRHKIRPSIPNNKKSLCHDLGAREWPKRKPVTAKLGGFDHFGSQVGISMSLSQVATIS